MNREEVIKGYTDNQKKYTWEVLGSNIITSTTKIYNKGMIYKVDIPYSSLEGNLIFCRNDYIGSLEWLNANIIDTFSGEISFGNNIINPNLISVMSKTEFDEADSSAIPDSFVPFQETLKEETGEVVISDNDYQQIISVLGYPYITEEELEYSREQICNIPLKRAITDYYRFFPRAVIYTYPVTGGTQEVEFPEGAYDILSYQIIQGTGTLDEKGQAAGEISNTFLRYIDLQMSGIGTNSSYGYGGLSSLTGNYYSMYSPKTLTSDINSAVLGRSAIQANINYLHRYRIDKILKTDENGNSKYYAKFYSNKLGSLIEITFAQKDLNYNHIDYARTSELIKLAQAYVKKFFADLRSQAKPISNNVVNYSEWKKEADDDIKAVHDLWASLIKFRGIQRGSL